MSKGSARRPGEGFADGWERIFGKAHVQKDLNALTIEEKAESIHHSAARLLADAEFFGLKVTITYEAVPPFIGDTGSVVKVWQK